MKKTYLTPDIQAVMVECIDVLTASGEVVKNIGGGDLGVSAAELFRNSNQ